MGKKTVVQWGHLEEDVGGRLWEGPMLGFLNARAKEMKWALLELQEASEPSL